MLRRFLKIFFVPRPTFFDICAGGLILIPFVRGGLGRSVFIILYIAFLVSISIGMTPKRQYRSLPLSLLTVWALLGLFIHSFVIYPTSITRNYLNLYMMTEGFIYIFFGILYIRTVYSYSTNIRFIYLLIPVAMIPWYEGLARIGSLTPLAALAVSATIYLLLSKRYVVGSAIATCGLVWMKWQWPWISMKFRCRPFIWGQLFKNMFYHPVRKDAINILDTGVEFSPFFEKLLNSLFPETYVKMKPYLVGIFGSGFSEYLGSEYTWVDKDKFGWVHRQSDFLSFGECLGPIALVILIWFLIRSIRRIGIQPALIMFMTIILVCFFQLTMFDPAEAGVCLAIGALCIWEGRKKEDSI